MSRIWNIFLLLVWAHCAVLFAAAPVKVAVISTSPTTAETAALLTASLSKNSDLALLEREALDKIMRERGLAATQLTNVLAASRILGADAIVFLETGGPRTNQTLNLRLVSVKKGAVLYATESAAKLDESERWVEKISQQIGPTALKIGADRSKLVPISTLNLRSPSSTPASELLDRELTSLLLTRLAAEKNVLLLERRKLLDVAFEKELAASTEQFLAGAYLLDGSVNKDGFQPGKTTFSLRLIAPNKEVTAIESTGARTNLATIIESAVAKIFESLKVAKTAPWDPQREASEQAEEARWALRWHMYPEAQAAADSAWALGLQTRQVAVTRVLAYGRDLAQTDPTYGRGGLYDLYRPNHVPSAERTATMSHAAAILDDLLNRDPPAVAETNVLAATIETLEKSGELLMAFYAMSEARAGKESQLAEWRRMCRKIQNVALHNPTVREPFANPAALKLRDFQIKFGLFQTNVFKTAVNYTGIFNETPEEAVAVIRDLVKEQGFTFIREVFFKRFSLPPVPRPTGGWKWADRKRDAAVWDTFVNELSSSTNVFVQLEGRLLELGLEGNWARFKAKQASLFQFLEEHWPEIEPRKQLLLLSDVALTPFFRNEGDYSQADDKEFEDLKLEGLQFFADRGVEVTQYNGRKFVTRKLQPVAAPSTPTPSFSSVLLGPSLKPDFIRLAYIGNGASIRTLEGPIFRKGRFWFRIRGATRPPPGHDSEIFAIDLKTKDMNVIPLSTNQFARRIDSMLYLRDSDHVSKPFEVHSNQLFVVEGTSVLHRPLDNESWTVVNIPSKDPDIYSVGGRLFLTASDTVYELEESGATRLLASARRRPPETPLDKFESLDYAPLATGRRGLPRIFSKGNVYDWDGDNWIALTQFTNFQCIVASGGGFFTSLDSPLFVQLHSMREGEMIPHYLAVGAYPQTDISLFRGAQNQWTVKAGNLRGALFFFGKIPSVMCQAETPKGVAWKIILFPPGTKNPIDLPLELDEQAGSAFTQAFIFGFRQPWVLDTPDGLVFGHARISGFWFIPKATLDSALSEATHAPETPSRQ